MSAALVLVDSAGLEGLSIRAIAKLVDAPPMSLYTHFSSKEELLDLMYAEIVSHLYADADHQTWQEGLRAVCREIRAVLMQHPRWAPLLSRPASPMEVPLRERLLGLMTADGIAPEVAFATLSSAVLVSIGLILVEFAFTSVGGPSNVTRRFERIKAWAESSSAPGHPVTHAALSKLNRFSLEDNFNHAVDALVAGFEAKHVSR